MAAAAAASSSGRPSLSANCSICLEPMSDRVFILPCHHDFDRACIQEWRTVDPTCPYCRSRISALKDEAGNVIQAATHPAAAAARGGHAFFDIMAGFSPELDLLAGPPGWHPMPTPPSSTMPPFAPQLHVGPRAHQQAGFMHFMPAWSPSPRPQRMHLQPHRIRAPRQAPSATATATVPSHIVPPGAGFSAAAAPPVAHNLRPVTNPGLPGPRPPRPAPRSVMFPEYRAPAASPRRRRGPRSIYSPRLGHPPATHTGTGNSTDQPAASFQLPTPFFELFPTASVASQPPAVPVPVTVSGPPGETLYDSLSDADEMELMEAMTAFAQMESMEHAADYVVHPAAGAAGGTSLPAETCHICSQPMTDRAVVIPCFHEFDFHCIDSVANSGTTIACPICSTSMEMIHFAINGMDSYSVKHVTPLPQASGSSGVVPANSTPEPGPSTIRGAYNFAEAIQYALAPRVPSAPISSGRHQLAGNQMRVKVEEEDDDIICLN